MLITLAEYKIIMQVTSTDATRDAAIEKIIPSIQQSIIDECSNHFLSDEVYFSSTSIKFTTTGAKITDSDNSPFIEYGFKNSMDIYVAGSMQNDGHYDISSSGVTASILTLATENVLIDEDEDYYVTIYRVIFPSSLKLIAAEIIENCLNKKNVQGITSESIGSYSVGFDGKLPQNIKDKLANYRKLSW